MMDNTKTTTIATPAPKQKTAANLDQWTILSKVVCRTVMPGMKAIGRATAELIFPDPDGPRGAGIWGISTGGLDEVLVACASRGDAEHHAASRALAAATVKIERRLGRSGCLQAPQITIYSNREGAR